jgi:catechol O-methyltransferase
MIAKGLILTILAVLTIVDLLVVLGFRITPTPLIIGSASTSFPMATEDAFAAFGSDDEEGDGAGRRDPANGMLQFHSGTEDALLHYVLNQDQNSGAAAVLKLMDQFCMERHWMMHVGPEKASVLTGFLTESFLHNRRNPASTFNILELGTYCGYSTIQLAHTLRSLAPTDTAAAFHIYTVDINPETIPIANKLIHQAGLTPYVTLLPLASAEPQSLIQLLRPLQQTFDFVFLDHAKTCYLRDLLALEQSQMIRSGTYVAADNVIFHQIDGYRSYVKRLAERGVVQTRLVPGLLEYYQYDPQLPTSIARIFPAFNNADQEKRDREQFRDGIGKSLLRVCLFSL